MHNFESYGEISSAMTTAISSAMRKISRIVQRTYSNELKIIYLRKSKVSVERLSVCNVIEKLMEHGIHCLPCSYATDVINIYYCNNYNGILMSK